MYQPHRLSAHELTWPQKPAPCSCGMTMTLALDGAGSGSLPAVWAAQGSGTHTVDGRSLAAAWVSS